MCLEWCAGKQVSNQPGIEYYVVRNTVLFLYKDASTLPPMKLCYTAENVCTQRMKEIAVLCMAVNGGTSCRKNTSTDEYSIAIHFTSFVPVNNTSAEQHIYHSIHTRLIRNEYSEEYGLYCAIGSDHFVYCVIYKIHVLFFAQYTTHNIFGRCASAV